MKVIEKTTEKQNKTKMANDICLIFWLATQTFNGA